MRGAIKNIFSGITKKQCADFGLVAILVTIILSTYLSQNYFTILALIVTLLTLICPIIFYPLAAVWLAFSKILGKISSIVLLTIIFFIVVTPVGLFRRLIKKDTLRIRQFKKSTKSVMVDRDHNYCESDLTHTF